MTNRHTRYQGAVIQEGKLLLIKHSEHETDRSYWVFPGGGREDGESEEECVVRELKEETYLEVEVASLVLDEEGMPGGVYKRRKTYLCKVIGGEAKPGYEPEEEANSLYAISEVRWFDLADDESWGDKLRGEELTYGQMKKLKKVLGYVE
jgi:ADP-ribose pyrophosphatase YjhB (NUDIX family)